MIELIKDQESSALFCSIALLFKIFRSFFGCALKHFKILATMPVEIYCTLSLSGPVGAYSCDAFALFHCSGIVDVKLSGQLGHHKFLDDSLILIAIV